MLQRIKATECKNAKVAGTSRDRTYREFGCLTAAEVVELTGRLLANGWRILATVAE